MKSLMQIFKTAPAPKPEEIPLQEINLLKHFEPEFVISDFKMPDFKISDYVAVFKHQEKFQEFSRLFPKPTKLWMLCAWHIAIEKINTGKISENLPPVLIQLIEKLIEEYETRKNESLQESFNLIQTNFLEQMTGVDWSFEIGQRVPLTRREVDFFDENIADSMFILSPDGFIRVPRNFASNPDYVFNQPPHEAPTPSDQNVENTPG